MSPPCQGKIHSRSLSPALQGFGWLSLLCYAGVAYLSFSFPYGEAYRERPILEVLGLLILATFLYLAALVKLAGWRKTAAGSGGLPAIIGFALAFRLVLLPSQPIQEIDFYRYLWDGRVCAAGVNPYRYAPDKVAGASKTQPRPPDFIVLQELTQASPALTTIFQRVHYREVPTIYPPASQAVFALAALMTPVSAPLWVHVLVWKILLLAFDLGTVLLLAGILYRLRWPVTWCLAYAWCPLGLKEFANSGHLDAIAVFFTVLAVFALVSLATTVTKNRSAVIWATAGLVALAVAVLAKIYPLILLPAFIAFLWGRLRGRIIFPFGAFVAALLAGFGPFLDASPLAGLKTFLVRWQMNDFLFMVVQENLRPASDHWFVITPADWREAVPAVAVGSGLNEGGEGTDPTLVWTQGLMGMVLLVLLVRWVRKVLERPQPEVLCRAVFLTLVWGWLLAGVQNPWYLIWSLPFMIFARSWSWFLLPGLVLVYYFRFWMLYHGLDKNTFDFGVVWLEYLPFFAALIGESCWRRRHLRWG